MLVVTSYCDESGTHGMSPVTIFAGIMGTANQWSFFKRKLDWLREKYGFRTFHTVEFKAKQGDFEGWPDEKCLMLIRELAELIGDGLMHGHVVTLENSAYNENYRGGEQIKKLHLDSAYGLCFRACLLHQVTEAMHRLSHLKKFDEVRLNIVAESGHKNAGDAIRIFNDVMAELKRYGSNMLSGITFEDKDSCAPLMVADFLAHSTFMRDDKGLMPPDISPDFSIVREKTGLTHAAFDADSLALQRALLIKNLEARRAYGARRHAPKKADATLGDEQSS
jgi:hypothetical protein